MSTTKKDKWRDPLGEFITWEIRPVVFNLFQERGIELYGSTKGVSVVRESGYMSIDLFVFGDRDALLIKAAIQLTQENVDEHLDRLSKFKQLMPSYREAKAFGAVAGTIVPDEIARYAYCKGLFVLAQLGETVIILNDKQFQPKTW